MKRNNGWVLAVLAMMPLLNTACSDDTTTPADEDKLAKKETNFGKKNDVFSAEEWYPGGELGTTEGRAYSDPTPAGRNVPGMEDSFIRGENFFVRAFTLTDNPYRGLGPAWVRNNCEQCHPSYGHGKRQTIYNGKAFGNGYLLVIYHPTAGVDGDGVAYAANSYVRHVTGMPQTNAMTPFKAPVDESGINIEWKTVSGTMPSGISATQFPDGEKFQLIYPEVTIKQEAFNTFPKPDNYEVRLESTIGLYGTGMLDAIDKEDMKAQYQKEAKKADLNPAMWNKVADDWAATAWYTLADGTKAIKKFTYGMTRASLQDGPGANAMWNITNVTRSDRRYLYTTDMWAKAMSMDKDVISYIKRNGKQSGSILHPYYGNGTDEDISKNVNMLLGLNAKSDADAYKKHFVDNGPFAGQDEMSNKDYYDFMVWHRGLAVPAARGLDNPVVQRGKKVFMEIGCTSCHRPSWKTGNDNYWVDNAIRDYAKSIGKNPETMLPRYAHQTIWPYTDLVQHRLFMANNIRTGWCRTPPLWGRGLSLERTGAEDRLHDCRARNEIEAIMWHAYDRRSDAFWAASKFYNLPKADRDAVVAFLRAI